MNNNTTHPKQQTTVKILEAIVLYLVCLFCLSIGIYYLLLDKPATAATGFVFAIFLFSLAKLDDFNVIDNASRGLRGAVQVLFKPYLG